jgi:MFS transporter, DHA2 family, methylenomycin A resistance protein
MAAGAVGLLWTGPGTPFADLVVQVVLLGAGLGLLVPLMTNARMSSVDRSRSGVAAGTLNAMRQTGSVLGVAVFGSLVAARSHFSSGLHVALVISVGLIIVGALLVRPLVPAGQVAGRGGARAPRDREPRGRG